MAITQNTFNGNGSNLGPFSFTFLWLESTDIKVSVNGVLKTAGTHYNLQGLNYATKSGGQVLFTAGNAPPVGVNNIRIYRETEDANLSANFVSGSAIRAQDLNDNFRQSLYVAQETKNTTVQAATGNLPDGSITNNLLANGAVTTAKIADGTILEADLAFTPLKSTDLGVSVQAYDADTAKTDVVQSYSAAQRGTHVTLTDGATITPDFAAGNHFTVILGGNRTLANPTNLTAGQSGVIYIVQNGSGNNTLAYGSSWDFAGGTVPTLSTAANAVDVLCYAVRSNSSIAATLIKDVK